MLVAMVSCMDAMFYLRMLTFFFFLYFFFYIFYLFFGFKCVGSWKSKTRIVKI